MCLPLSGEGKLNPPEKNRNKKQKLASCQKICKVLNPRCGFVPYCRTTGCGEGEEKKWLTHNLSSVPGLQTPSAWMKRSRSRSKSVWSLFPRDLATPLFLRSPSAPSVVSFVSFSISTFHPAASNPIILQKFIENKYKLFFFFFNSEGHFQHNRSPSTVVWAEPDACRARLVPPFWVVVAPRHSSLLLLP